MKKLIYVFFNLRILYLMYTHDSKMERYNNSNLVDFDRKFMIPIGDINNYIEGNLKDVNSYRIDNVKKEEEKKKEIKKEMEEEGIYMKYKLIKDYEIFLNKELYTIDNRVEMTNKNYNLILKRINEMLEKKYNSGKLFQAYEFKDESEDILQLESTDDMYEFVWNEHNEYSDDENDYDGEYEGVNGIENEREEYEYDEEELEDY